MTIHMRNVDCALRKHNLSGQGARAVLELRSAQGLLLVSGSPAEWLALTQEVLNQLEEEARCVES